MSADMPSVWLSAISKDNLGTGKSVPKFVKAEDFQSPDYASLGRMVASAS